MKRKTIILALLALAGATSILLAQNPPKPPDPATMAQHRVQHLTTLLSLNASQQQQATTIFTNAATSMAGVHGSMKAAHQSLHTAIQNNDTAAIDQLSANIGNLTAQQVATEAKAHAALFQILTPDQQTKLSAFESERPGMGMGMHVRHMGPGPGPFGPGPQ